MIMSKDPKFNSNCSVEIFLNIESFLHLTVGGTTTTFAAQNIFFLVIIPLESKGTFMRIYKVIFPS